MLKWLVSYGDHQEKPQKQKRLYLTAKKREPFDLLKTLSIRKNNKIIKL